VYATGTFVQIKYKYIYRLLPLLN